VDVALGKLTSSSQEGLEGLRALLNTVRRLEAKLDRLASAAREKREDDCALDRGSEKLRPLPSAKNSEAGMSGGERERWMHTTHIVSELGKGQPELDRNLDLARDGRYQSRRPALISTRHSDSPALQKVESGPNSESKQETPAKAVDLRLEMFDKKLEKISRAVGVRAEAEMDEKENRRRLKEKLKEALDSEQRNRLELIESKREQWLEYFFGICKPDGRIGKNGSRYGQRMALIWLPRPYNLTDVRVKMQAHSSTFSVCSRYKYVPSLLLCRQMQRSFRLWPDSRVYCVSKQGDRDHAAATSTPYVALIWQSYLMLCGRQSCFLSAGCFFFTLPS
jgi:hypothetical protein